VVVDDGGKPVRAFGTVQDVTERKLAEQELRASRAQLRALAAYLQSVREEERAHIARELHDEIGAGLTAIKLALERSASDQSAGAATDPARALALANELIGRVRDLSLELRPAMLDDLGVVAALRWHFKRYTDQFQIAVDFKDLGLSDRRFSAETETAVYRIVQEALTNVARHAQINKVAVQIDVDYDLLRVRIKDEGTGFDPDSLPAERSGGLTGMRERAIMLGGRLWLESAAGLGTMLRAEIPLHKHVPIDDC
jgi:signal transduction histidine kinase